VTATSRRGQTPRDQVAPNPALLRALEVLEGPDLRVLLGPALEVLLGRGLGVLPDRGLGVLLGLALGVLLGLALVDQPLEVRLGQLLGDQRLRVQLVQVQAAQLDQDLGVLRDLDLEVLLALGQDLDLGDQGQPARSLGSLCPGAILNRLRRLVLITLVYTDVTVNAFLYVECMNLHHPCI